MGPGRLGVGALAREHNRFGHHCQSTENKDVIATDVHTEFIVIHTAFASTSSGNAASRNFREPILPKFPHLTAKKSGLGA